MDDREEARGGPPAPARGGTERDRMTVGAMLGLVVGLAVSFWLNLDAFREGMGPRNEWILATGGAVLGGVSAAGVPILLWRRWREAGGGRRRWGPGRILWFSQGAAAWLLWPPTFARRVQEEMGREPGGADTARICYFYGTPLMALYVVAALWAGGWLRRSRRRRSRRGRGWSEGFGLGLGLLWALLGVYVLYLIYRDDLR